MNEGGLIPTEASGRRNQALPLCDANGEPTLKKENHSVVGDNSMGGYRPTVTPPVLKTSPSLLTTISVPSRYGLDAADNIRARQCLVSS